ncbi:hypothetical protein M231_02594 [Tremella mesenterica]|uniref:Exosome complex protein n=1 Tax=Tremella mesenterica TaxID=5217 RepID=A0A4V1M4F0_TREME|nr:uncharacterized protein TREMEDRAFT_61259 [Tremella mesenterica DSM 1558]EIW70752.1 hypothetical protein TREMEDRAFT_61259 [Tremella mesenterica DSM 1558]RXK40137.1 hypothetical protein M231_02594 [Tremella mesenterica]
MSDFNPSSSSKGLVESIKAVQDALEPLHQRPFSDTLDELESLDRAKMDILLAYTISDLLWIYLKMKGHDPSLHPVAGELERIRTYYEKIKLVESGSEQRKNKVDVNAARRFIKHHLPPSCDPTLDEMPGRAERFRFVAADGKEKMIPGQVEAEDDAMMGKQDGTSQVDESMDVVNENVDMMEDVTDTAAPVENTSTKSVHVRKGRARAEDYT